MREKFVKAHQRQKEGEFLLLHVNIHAWNIMLHFKEISHVHLIVMLHDL